MATKYDRIVDQIRVLIIKDANGRLRIGELVNAALDAGGSIKCISDDVGISRSTLLGYAEASRFWGSARIPNGADNRPAPFWYYTAVAATAADMSDRDARELKARMVRGGRDEVERWNHARWAELRAERDEGFRRDPHESLWNSLRTARYYISTIENDGQPPLTALERRKARDIIREILAAASEYGIPLDAPRRRGRAA